MASNNNTGTSAAAGSVNKPDYYAAGSTEVATETLVTLKKLETVRPRSCLSSAICLFSPPIVALV